jgi:hypothetical protein
VGAQSRAKRAPSRRLLPRARSKNCVRFMICTPHGKTLFPSAVFQFVKGQMRAGVANSEEIVIPSQSPERRKGTARNLNSSTRCLTAFDMTDPHPREPIPFHIIHFTSNEGSVILSGAKNPEMRRKSEILPSLAFAFRTPRSLGMTTVKLLW